MNAFALVLPAVTAVVVGVPAAGRHRRLHPSVRSRALAVATAALPLAVGAAVATLAVGFLSGVPGVAERISWCRPLARTHDKVPAWLGIPALAALAAMTTAAIKAYLDARRTVFADTQGQGEVRVVEDDRPDAYAVAGHPGHIVISSGMLRILDGRERAVLLAHERAHLRNRHHRYLLLARVSAAAVPMARLVTRRLRLAVECWADEDAAVEVGDRRLVARTLIRAALARTAFSRDAGLRLGELGVPARVEALLGSPPVPLPGPSATLLALPGTAAALATTSAVQVHHLLGFAWHVCRL